MLGYDEWIMNSLKIVPEYMSDEIVDFLQIDFLGK